MLKVLTVIGTRPETIKLAPVIMELEKRCEHFSSKICATAQHREMLDQALMTFDIKPDYDLDIMTENQNLTELTSRVTEKLSHIFEQEQPDVLLVQGDTTSAFCSALVAFYHQIKIGHVEAGLRTENKYAPFPEEINRRLVARLTDYHFVPTETARAALLREGIPDAAIFITGNTVIDALQWVHQKNREEAPRLSKELEKAIEGRTVILVTGHRRESFEKGIASVCGAILDVAKRFPDVSFVYPVHHNPNVHREINKRLGDHKQIHLIAPLPYETFVWMMDRALIILTDSGGIQEEAPSMGKPVLVTRELTERPEGLQTGNALLVGFNRKRIVEVLTKLLRDSDYRSSMAVRCNPYGDGKAAIRIVDILSQI